MSISINFLAALIGTLFLFSCNRTKETPQAKEESPIPDSLVRQVRTTAATMEPVIDEIRLNGKVIPSEGKQSRVYALVSGKISGATKELGDYVHKGQTLAVLRSTEVVGMSHDIVLAESNVAIAKKNMESADDLFRGGLATEKELTGARVEYNKAVAELTKAKQVSAITGGSKSSYVLSAPISGFIIEKSITNNSEVRQDNDTPLFVIADLSSVWVVANVYERDINSIHIGDAVKVNTLSNPSTDYMGTIDKIYNILNPTTRTMQVRISMSNASYELKPEMFATVRVNVKTPGRMLAIPYTSIVFGDNKLYVVVKKNDNTIEKRNIKLIKKVGDKAFVEGLAEGEHVVTQSQVFLFEALNAK